MKKIVYFLSIALMGILFQPAIALELTPELKAYLKSTEKEVKNIPDERKPVLDAISTYITNSLVENHKSRLLFVCTHNSRRSQMSQGMASAAAAYYKIPFVYTYSGGIEKTAFNPRAVNAMKKAGFLISVLDSANANVKYEVKILNNDVETPFYSKLYTDEANPKSDFAAVMVCSDADEACPIVYGADLKFPLPYEDPRLYDGTKDEVKAYDSRLRQIAAEQLYVMENVKKQIKMKRKKDN